MSVRVALLLGLLALACKGDAAPEPDPAPDPEVPPAISEAEADRGKQACADYQRLVCECSKRGEDPELARECKGADARLEGMALQLRALNAENMEMQDRRVVQAAVRKTIKACIEDVAALKTRCP